jgi:hypothetical protein
MSLPALAVTVAVMIAIGSALRTGEEAAGEGG